MKNLPFWHLTNKYPSFHDVDSKTSVEMVAKVYGAMNDLITECNNFHLEIQKTIENEKLGNEEFKKCITDLVDNYIKLVDEKIQCIEEMVKNTLSEIGGQSIKDAIEQGKIVATPIYEEGTENLSIGISYKE